VELGKGASDDDWNQLALGMAAFRNDLRQEADRILEGIAGKEGEVGGTASYFRAMCLFQEQKHAAARELFLATEATTNRLPSVDDDIMKASTPNLLHWLAYKEAGVIMNMPLEKAGEPTPGSPAPKQKGEGKSREASSKQK
jgi:hypothetical protein